MVTPVKFLSETRDEVAKVVWPTREQVIRLTLIVIVISVAVGIYIGALDYIFTQATTLLIK